MGPNHLLALMALRGWEGMAVQLYRQYDAVFRTSWETPLVGKVIAHSCESECCTIPISEGN
jgi:hypothetical protein